MPGNFDYFIVTVACPGCGVEVAEAYGRLRRDPRLTCRCGIGFAVYLAGSPVEEADRLWDLRAQEIANDNGGTPFLVKG